MPPLPPWHICLQVAQLFDSLSSSSAVACSQVLCVSHNAAFQQLCQHVVKLTRGPAGTALAPSAGGGGGGGAGGAAAPRGKEAAAPVGRSKKARSK